MSFDERDRELMEAAAGGANSTERAIDLPFHQQTPTVPASQPTSSSPSMHPQTKKKKSRTRGANPAHLLPKAAYTKVDTTNPPSFFSTSPTVAEFQAHAAKTATADGGDGQDALALIPAKGVAPCEALRNVPKKTVTETVNVNGDIPPPHPVFSRICAQDVPRGCKVHRQWDQTVIQVSPSARSCDSKCKRSDFVWAVRISLLYFWVLLMLAFILNGVQNSVDIFSLSPYWMVLGLPIVVVWFWLLTLLGTRLFDSTYVTINNGGVTVDHRPFCARSETTKFDDEGVYPEIRVYTSQREHLLRIELMYEVRFENRDRTAGPHPALFSHEEFDVAMFVQQEILKFLTP